MARPSILSDRQIGTIEAFVAMVLDAYKAGTVDRKSAVLAISRVMLAVDKGSEAEISYPLPVIDDDAHEPDPLLRPSMAEDHRRQTGKR